MADPRKLLQLGALLHDVGEVVALASSATGAAQRAVSRRATAPWSC